MIHSSVIIEDGASIADDVTIGPFCSIGKDVTIASGCKFEANIILKGKVRIGENVKIFSFTTIGRDESTIEIGANTHIREFVQIGTQDDANEGFPKIVIGNNNFLMGYVQIYSGVEIGEFSIITNAVKFCENVKCEERIIVGGFSSVSANNKIGTGVMIGGASHVDHDMPPFTLVEGNKAEIKGLNVIGLRRRLENKDDIEDVKAIFKRILGISVDKELAKEIAKTHENEYVKRLSAFVANSNI
ncbi:acyl-ACP--UDP-N- acetylglucosamine O-acyltransferase [Sulfurimonas sp. SAG-AH-194-I05]|nr:acyl-ACP--UDP-N- acetylglucosamine O-acyltransferase [Sulfurimonas sp. SAG-AH-194-I05]MDF1876154.1 acyl-ACP--UDP-N- acetylglucosamine O-acyltransferase [Sulfurimonas sp. SAG-AH-194-I05]